MRFLCLFTILLFISPQSTFADELGFETTKEGIINQLGQTDNSISKKLRLKIRFDLDSSNIRKDSYTLLDKLGSVLISDRFRGITMVIAGHTDHIGDEKYNKELSLKRAKAIRKYLLENFNLANSQLLVFGFGETRPLFDKNHSDIHRQLNRRVEIIPAEQFE